jgi:hypothetical protein
MSDTDNADMAVQLLQDYICNAAAAVHGCPAARTIQHNIVINHGLILNVAASIRTYLHMQSFILTTI